MQQNKICCLYTVKLQTFSTLMRPHARKKATALMTLEVMKWWKYFFDDVMSDAKL
jgi:hypothetical protein